MGFRLAKKIFDKEGIEGLKDRTKSGRTPELLKEIIYQIKQELKENNCGWTNKQVEELIVKKNGIKYHYSYIYRILRKRGFKEKALRKIMLILHPMKKMISKKTLPRHLHISSSRKQSLL